MNPVVAFVGGLIIGWVAKWLINTPFGRENAQGTELESVRAKLGRAETHAQGLQTKLDEALSRGPEIIVVRVELIKEKERLQQIRGIGPVFEERFSEAGINTFADLATLTPERIQEIINPEKWQAIDPASWISEAQQLIAGRNGTN